ncbi:FAD-binding and (Fe-S)-binding domain-containing protein [Schaalia odontolytica]|uniref:Glycolate oxidase subunit GlcD n=1 Tax=Schaalia odontolytica TaxID=1660 RepID=A0A2X0VQS8_9ACTO|nr:FAD-binding and (Fe-S)-binding domain-containing protein [Schaalia odontolytica]WMS28104.1 FAD-binding and (Fe-S)-binding domain-containing protein [Schaalia odontolytica]SPT56041.1 glycolate oxidase subunit GlcD [Schaalia odontolytica]
MSESFLTDLRTLIDVDSSRGTRARYSSDAGLTRIPPLAVAFPRTPEQAIAAFDLARAHGVPLTARGGGTSCASNAIGPGLVLDFSRHMNRVISIDPKARTATVEPGCVGSTLQAAAGTHGLRFGPDPSSQNRATIAGMVANNACGPHATAWGRTCDNIVSLDCVDGQGRRFTATTRHDGALSDVPGLASLIDSNLAPIRTELGRFKRQVSGYSLEHLTPEGGRNLAAMLAGTEGTLVLILSITVRLVPLPEAPVLAALGYHSMIDAADDVPALLAHSPLAVEGMDRRLVDVVRAHKGPGAVPALPEGDGWLLVEVGAPGEDLEVTLERARTLCADSAAVDTVVYPPGTQASALWRIRADGAGLGGRTPPDGAGGGDQQAWPGFEDAAVPPEKLGDYLRDFTALMEEFDIDGLLYGHFGDGCVHVRLSMPLETPEGVAHSRAFLQSAARICAAHGGSVSGEHGDGRARGELLRFMYSPEMLDLFARVKHVFDPGNLLNPGVLAAPMDEAEAASRSKARASGFAGNSVELQPGVDPLDRNLRRVSARPMPADGGFAFTHDGGDFTAAVHRCTGVGKCRAGVSGTFMCPSYLATRDEKDVTRGRARILQEAANSQLVKAIDSPEVLEALDLCLACKACSADCPAGVDMARYRSEALFRTYRGRPRPLSHYTLGWLPRLTRVTARVPGLAAVANALMSVAPLRSMAFRIIGLDPRRGMPDLQSGTFNAWARRRSLLATSVPSHSDPGTSAREHGNTPAWSDSAREREAATASSLPDSPILTGPRDPGGRPYALVWADSFSQTLDDTGARAVVDVLEANGFAVIVAPDACCGLTWITTGQLTGAKKHLTSLLGTLAPFAAAGIPIVGVEPSCTAVLRDDLSDLLPDDPRSVLVAGATHTLAEVLSAVPASARRLPSLEGVEIVAQPHCHHYSVMGWDTDQALLESLGARVTRLEGCCGLAGNFGMEAGHYDLSVAVASHSLLPTLSAHPEAVYLADGFSCRTQAAQLADRGGIHLATLLAPR